MYVDWSLVVNSGVAAGTFSLAGVTYWLARSTKYLAEETRRERELEFQPYLLLNHEGEIPFYSFKNVGRGLALNCRYCFHYPDSAAVNMDLLNPWASDPMDLGPGDEERDLPVRDGSQNAWIQDVLRGLPAGTTFRDQGRRYAIVCEDQFGILYQFCPIPGKSEPDTWRKDQRPIPDWIYWPPRSKPDSP